MAASTPSSEVPDIAPKAQTARFPFIPAPLYHGAYKHEATMTYHPKSDFLRVMQERGFVADCTDYQSLDKALLKGVVPAYIGYDATAASLHVGHLMNIMVLRWLQNCGHKPITLMGGGRPRSAIRPSAPRNARC